MKVDVLGTSTMTTKRRRRPLGLVTLLLQDGQYMMVTLLGGDTYFALPFSLFVLAASNKVHKLWFSSSNKTHISMAFFPTDDTGSMPVSELDTS